LGTFSLSYCIFATSFVAFPSGRSGLGTFAPHISPMKESENMKGSNLFYGILLLLITYFIEFVTSINVGNIFGYPINIPNPFYVLGQMTFFNVPVWVFLGFLGFLCLITAFQSDKKIVVQEVRSK